MSQKILRVPYATVSACGVNSVRQRREVATSKTGRSRLRPRWGRLVSTLVSGIMPQCNGVTRRYPANCQVIPDVRMPIRLSRFVWGNLKCAPAWGTLAMSECNGWNRGTLLVTHTLAALRKKKLSAPSHLQILQFSAVCGRRIRLEISCRTLSSLSPLIGHALVGGRICLISRHRKHELRQADSQSRHIPRTEGSIDSRAFDLFGIFSPIEAAQYFTSPTQSIPSQRE